MTVRFTSLEAYQELLASGEAANQAEQIYAVLLASRKPRSRRELSLETGIEIGAVPRAVLDLIATGLAVETEAMPCPITENQVFGVMAASRVQKPVVADRWTEPPRTQVGTAPTISIEPPEVDPNQRRLL